MLTKLTLYVDRVLFTVLPLCVEVHVFGCVGCVTMHRHNLFDCAIVMCRFFLNRLNIYFNLTISSL